MKNIFKLLFILLFGFNIGIASAWVIDHFEVEFPTDSALNLESIDLVIRAVDKNNDIVTDYTWNILGISQSDEWIILPEDLASDQWYTFKLSDQWVRKFENWVTFSTPWEHTLSVFDTNDYENLTGRWEITIIDSGPNQSMVEIEILTPDSNTTLPSENIKVSWATKKNHQVKIKLNDKEEFITTSNSDWIFEKEIIWLNTWENTLKAYVLDSDEKIIWESKEVVIKIDNNQPSFKKITLSPVSEDWKVEEWVNIDAKVFANTWLKTVKLLFNDQVISLSETEDGIYTWWFKTPNKYQKFPIDVELSDHLWHTITKKDATFITVTMVPLNDPDTVIPKPETCSWVTIEELEIKWLKVVKLKNKSILTWDKVDKAESYDIFIKNEESSEFDFVKNSVNPIFETEITWDKIKYQYFAVKSNASWCGSWEIITWNSWEIISWNLSEATKVQTWPTELILMLLLSLILWFGFVLIKRNNA